MTRRLLLWGFCLSMIGFAVNELLPTDFALDQMRRLQYPPYLLTILAIGKLTGAAILLSSRRRWLREWALAGFAVDLVGALASHLMVADYEMSGGSIFYGLWLAALVASERRAAAREPS